MGKNQISAVVLRIWLKFWWMIPMGVKYNHAKYEPKTKRWRPGRAVASGGPRFQKLQFRAKSSHFWAKTGRESSQNGQAKGDGGYTPGAIDFPVSTSPLRPSNSTICP